MIALGTIAMGLAGGVLSQALPLGPLNNTLGGLWNSIFQNERLDAGTLVRLRLWAMIDDEHFHEQMAKHGYSTERADLTVVANANWMDPIAIIRSGWRNGDKDEEIISNLVQHGWIEKEAQGFLTAAKYYPSPAELVHWQAKEVFEKDMVEKYGLGAELGGVDREPFYKAGMDDDQIRNHWLAHWNHPAWNQTTEMMHRGELEESELSDWFKLMEIPPFWREKMIATSYKPLTRVDVRRMHKIGVLDEAGLVRAYKDVGYNQEKAEKMRDFTIQYNQQVGEDPDRDLTRSMLEKGYRLGMLSPSEFDDYLKDMGFSEANSSFIRQIVDMDVSMDRAYDRLASIRNQVGAGLMTVQEAGIKLSQLGFSDDSVQHYEWLFSEYVQEPTKIPSKTDLKKWVAAEVITEQDGFSYLKALGYADKECYYYIKEWTGAEERYEEWIDKMRAIAAR